MQYMYSRDQKGVGMPKCFTEKPASLSHAGMNVAVLAQN